MKMKYISAFILIATLTLLSSCGGGSSSDNSITTFTVSASAGANGTISPGSATVNQNDTTSFTVTPNTGYAIDSVSGCGGTLVGNTYTTGAITSDCSVSASFVILSYSVTTTVGANGSISPDSSTVNSGDTTDFSISPDPGYTVDTVSGCGGSLLVSTYTTGAITSNCTISASFTLAIATPALSYVATKALRFNWTDITGVTHYKLLENLDGVSGFSQVGADIPPGTEVFDHIVPLYKCLNALYLLQSCFAGGCNDSAVLSVSGTLANSIGYLKASNTDSGDRFGLDVSISGDGNTLAVGAYGEESDATGVNGDQSTNPFNQAGAVYIFTRNGITWTQQAYLKASNTTAGDIFGWSVSLNADGNTLVVGANHEDSNATGVNGNQSDNSAPQSGAAYVFVRSGITWSQQAYLKASNTEAYDDFGKVLSISADGNTLAIGAISATVSGAAYVFVRNGITWSQQAYIKASNPEPGDHFAWSLGISGDGNTLAVGAYDERSNATGINGNQSDNSAYTAGAIYVFVRVGNTWSQQSYIKASNTEAGDGFGTAVSINADGNTLAVSASESSNATGINGNQSDNSALNSGAVYVFVRSGVTWSQQAYIKASNTDAGDGFGTTVSINADGNTLAVGAGGEDSNAVGVGGDENNNGTSETGAAYVFVRSGVTWSQQAYIKASNTGFGDDFGSSVSLSADGNTLAVGAMESSNATGVGGDQNNNLAPNAGAVYLY